jgi:hypothetical protein
MASDQLAMAEFVLVFAGILAFGFWQLRELRKLREAREAEQAKKREDGT